MVPPVEAAVEVVAVVASVWTCTTFTEKGFHGLIRKPGEGARGHSWPRLNEFNTLNRATNKKPPDLSI